MDWVLQSPQIHSTFSNLGYAHTDGYHINENCNAALEAILHNILTEDKYLRSYRRNISFGQNIKKDLIPLLINAKEDKSVELLIQIFVNLTTPIECLFNVEDISKSDFGRHTVFEINNLLTATKTALTDHRATKVIIEFLKKNAEWEQKTKIPKKQCHNIENILLFLRNILHIPDDVNHFNPSYNGPTHTVQNQILWNLFSQSIDKILIKLINIPESGSWGVTMVQLIALLYKDQHVTTLHKLLNVWLETSLSESSEDNESNTSPPNRGSDHSSPMLTSDPTSDSSDTGASGKCNDASNSRNNAWETKRNTSDENSNQSTSLPTSDNMISMDYSNDNGKDDNVKSNQKSSSESNITERTSQCHSANNEKKTVVAENSDCGYGTQIENQESISTSSNEDDLPAKKPAHQKSHNTKQRINNKTRSSNATVQERKRKKIVKRGKSNIINVQGLSHNTPTDEDISNILKEFTVDFLLKGFNSLVKTLHDQILSNRQLEIDTSHFFWLVTYFLKFATQIELDLEHVCSVLSFDIISYITAEGVNICEQFELAIKLDGNDLKPGIRRLHLVVTAIREFVQAIEVYKKSVHMSNDDQQTLLHLQMKMCETEELRSLLVLLLRHYNPKYHSKQYLQDLVVTNHILLMFLDGLMKLPEYKGTSTMVDHIRQFADPDVMYQYGLLLEDYEGNGEFVNDCVFTVMHHVAGELGSLICLFQPKIIKAFTSIWKSEFEICDDWSDLVEYVINTFVKKPHTLHNHLTFRLEPESFEDEIKVTRVDGTGSPIGVQRKQYVKNKSVSSHKSSRQRSVGYHFDDSVNAKETRWSDDEISSLNWYYLQCNTSPDTIGGIVKLFKEDAITKSRESVTRQLIKQCLISKEEFDKLMNMEMQSDSKVLTTNKDTRDGEIGKLCEQITQDEKSKYLIWVQTVLLETCNVKIHLNKKVADIKSDIPKKGVRVVKFDLEEKKKTDLPSLSPVSYHSLLFNQSVPLVPWNCEQSTMCKDLKFLQLLHKLGFHMPVDTGKVFIRIPNFWTPDILYEVAAKISPIDTSKLKFSLSDISESSLQSLSQHSRHMSVDFTKDIHMNASPENFYQVHKQRLLATAVNFTPMPSTSFTSSSEKMKKSNWLEMVQKSQEYKLSLNLHGTNEAEDDEDIHMVATTDMMISNDMAVTRGLVTTLPDTILSLPTIMSGQETTNYSAQLESEYNNSVCETASVASDLTRMYVSDEDEKPEDLLTEPRGATLDVPLEVSLHPVIADIRPRVQFSPTFLSPGRTMADF